MSAKADHSSKDISTTTLLISSLPQAYTSVSLSALLSSIGPIRTAFVVTAGSTDNQPAKSKGYGFAKYVLKNDAEKAITELNGTLIDGKRISVSWAKRRQRGDITKEQNGLSTGDDFVPLASTSTGSASQNVNNAYASRRQAKRIEGGANGTPPGPHTAADNRKDARTVIIEGGLDASQSEELKALRNRLKKAVFGINKGDGALQPADIAITSGTVPTRFSAAPVAPPAGQDGDEQGAYPETQQVALLECPNARSALALADKLHNSVLKSHLVLAKVKFDSDLARKRPNAAESRLIVRNLGFDVSALDLACTFAPFGPILSLQLHKGFAFVHFLRKEDAEKAMAKLNGSRIFAGFLQQRIDEAANHKFSSTLRKEEKGKIVGVRGRQMAVDWALAKSDYERLENGEVAAAQDASKEAKTNTSKTKELRSYDSDTSEDEEESDLDPIALDDADDDEEEEEADMSPEPMAIDEDADINAADLERPEDAESEHEVDNAKSSTQDTGTTLFIRNVQFEATESELFELFKAFGPVRYARIVMDPVTKRSRGTGFVNFYREEDALACLQEGDRLAAQTGVSTTGDVNDKKRKSKAVIAPRSLLSADPSSTSAARLSLHGRVLGVSPAVSKGQADKLREDRDKSGKTKDRRNLYLMHEGTILPDSPLAEGLTSADIQTRSSSFESRKGLLRTNPALFVSRSRLALRQIPLFVTDGMLRRMAGWAIKSFDDEAKKGRRSKLTIDELREPLDALGVSTVVPKADGAIGETKKAKKGFNGRGSMSNRIVQAKILRQDDRIDPLTGFKRSKGYGFLELADHADALRVIRWANANPAVHKLLHSWWIEDLETRIAQLQDTKAKGEAAVSSKNKSKATAEDADDDVAGRVTRMQAKLDELKDEAAKAGNDGQTAKRQGKTLIVEFAIENAMTVKRRAEKVEKARERSQKRKRDEEEQAAEQEQEHEVIEVPENTAPADSRRPLGSIIGKKRRIAKQKRGGK